MNNSYNNNRNSRNNSNYRNNYNNYDNCNNNDKHPEHPVRNVFFAIFSVFFSLAFNYLWVCQLIDFEYTDQAMVISVVILICAFIGGAIAIKKSYRGNSWQKKRYKRIRNKHTAYRKRLKNRYYR